MANVSIRGLTKKFAEVAAVDDFHLEIGDGEFVSLLGPSGCGKTTTLRLLAGFLQPDGGEIRAGGEVISSPAHLVPPERRQMSMIFQSYAVWPHMTVAQNVAYGLKFKKLTKQEIEKKVTKLLGVVHLAELKDRYAAELSGGQQQRVALARALVVEPQILLMDEPLSNLDANLREEMRFEIRRLHEAFGITTLYVTHDQAEAMVISDRVAVLHRGRLAQVGRVADLFERPRTRFVAEFIGKTNLVDAVGEAPGVVARDGVRLRVGGDPVPRGAAVALSIRPHTLVLVGEGEPASAADNVLAGVVERATYLGDAVDYQVRIDASDLVLRVSAPPARRRQPGDRVRLAVPAEACVPLAADEP